MLSLVPDGPYRKSSQRTNMLTFFDVLKNDAFRSVAFGYFEHMWELYAFWTFVPIMLKKYNLVHPQSLFDVPLLTILIIGVAGLACIISGYIGQKSGVKKIAFLALLFSFSCASSHPQSLRALMKIYLSPSLYFEEWWSLQTQRFSQPWWRKMQRPT